MAVSVPYLKLCGYVTGGWLLAKSAAIAAGKATGAEREFYRAKVRTASFYAAQVLPLANALARVVAGRRRQRHRDGRGTDLRRRARDTGAGSVRTSRLHDPCPGA